MFYCPSDINLVFLHHLSSNEITNDLIILWIFDFKAKVRAINFRQNMELVNSTKSLLSIPLSNQYESLPYRLETFVILRVHNKQPQNPLITV